MGSVAWINLQSLIKLCFSQRDVVNTMTSDHNSIFRKQDTSFYPCPSFQCDCG